MRLRDIREDEDLTQSDIARILKTTQASYSRWENEKEIIPLKKLTIFCNFFDVSIDYTVGITRTNTSNGFHKIDSKTIGKRLKELRKIESIRQNDLAKLLNTSQSTISAYEAGDTTLLTIFAIEICKKYNVSLDWLCGRTEDSNIYIITNN